jgi:hypothetical protein
MQGIHFVTDEKGQKVAVQLDLELYGDLWEDLYDQITARNRANEKREPIDALRRRLVESGKLRG